MSAESASSADVGRGLEAARGPQTGAVRRWPGLDHGFHRAVASVAGTPEGQAVHAWQQEQYSIHAGSTFPVGIPVMVGRDMAQRTRAFVRAYHRCIETVVRESARNGDVRQVLTLPDQLRSDLDRDPHHGDHSIHLCRLDLLPTVDGGFKVLETNANCPGGLLYSGRASRAWREVLEPRGVALAEPLAHEDPLWMGRWFLDVAQRETGVLPRRVVLLREEGGNRLELGALVRIYEDLGVESWEADPRACAWSDSGECTVDGRPVGHAYLKLGIQAFLAMRDRLEPFVEALSTRRLFVQNGLGGRWIGDNKLCLAVLSDPTFQDLFSPDDQALLREHVPWSRNLSLCDGVDLQRIHARKDEYVLKSPLDTRGRGVVVGREVPDRSDWARKVEEASRDGWLVQTFCEAAEVETDFGSAETHKHDLALGAINGEVQAAFMRSSGEHRVNVARAGRMHPVFLDADRRDDSRSITA